MNYYETTTCSRLLEVIYISASWLLLAADSEFVSRVFEDVYSCLKKSLFITSSSLRDNSTVVLHDAFERKKQKTSFHMMLRFVGNERGVMWSTLLFGVWGGLY